MQVDVTKCMTKCHIGLKIMVKRVDYFYVTKERQMHAATEMRIYSPCLSRKNIKRDIHMMRTIGTILML
jgi:hypothetical protein